MTRGAPTLILHGQRPQKYPEVSMPHTGQHVLTCHYTLYMLYLMYLFFSSSTPFWSLSGGSRSRLVAEIFDRRQWNYSSGKRTVLTSPQCHFAQEMNANRSLTWMVKKKVPLVTCVTQPLSLHHWNLQIETLF